MSLIPWAQAVTENQQLIEAWKDYCKRESRVMFFHLSSDDYGSIQYCCKTGIPVFEIIRQLRQTANLLERQMMQAKAGLN